MSIPIKINYNLFTGIFISIHLYNLYIFKTGSSNIILWTSLGSVKLYFLNINR